MAATLTVSQRWVDGKRLHVVGNINLSGNYVTGGIPLDFNNLANALPGPQAGQTLGYPGFNAIPTNQPIVHSDVVGRGGYYGYNLGVIYSYRYVPQPSSAFQGSGPNSAQPGLLRIYVDEVELAAGAIPANILSDVIDFYGIFTKNF